MSGSINTNQRYSGIVKFFNSQKGYGFIIPFDGKPVNPNGRAEIFVHHSAIQNDGGFKSLAENEQVEYSLVQGPKGIQAANVTGPGGAPVKGDPMINRMFFHHDNFVSPFGSTFMTPYNQMGYAVMTGMPPQFYGTPMPGQNFPGSQGPAGQPILMNPGMANMMKGNYNPGGMLPMGPPMDSPYNYFSSNPSLPLSAASSSYAGDGSGGNPNSSSTFQQANGHHGPSPSSSIASDQASWHGGGVTSSSSTGGNESSTGTAAGSGAGNVVTNRMTGSVNGTSATSPSKDK